MATVTNVTLYDGGYTGITISWSSTTPVTSLEYVMVAQGWYIPITLNYNNEYTGTQSFDITGLTSYPCTVKVFVKGNADFGYSTGYIASSESVPSSQYSDTLVPIYYPRVQHQYVWNNTYTGSVGEVGSCVANTLVSLKEVMEYKETGKQLDFSCSFIYGNRLSSHYQGEGMYVNEALDMLRDEGTILARFLPENCPSVYPATSTSETRRYPDNRFYIDGTSGVTKGAKTVTTAAKTKTGVVRQAKKYKIRGYSRYKYKQALLDTVKKGIMDHGAIVFEILLPTGFPSLPSTGVITNDQFTATYQARHAMVVLGWKQINGKHHWICQNSWDTWWGDSGRCYIPVDWIGIDYVYIVQDEVNSANWKHWEWANTMIKDLPFNCAAVDWNAFTSKVNDVRNSFGLSLSTFTPAVSGQQAKFYQFNEVRNSINALNPTGLPLATNNQADATTYNRRYKIPASDFHILRDKLNEV